MKKLSNEVITNQSGINENLIDLINRNKENEFRKPFSDFSIQAFEEIEKWVIAKGQQPIILDMCCGVGESSFLLAKEDPNTLVIGIDKSLDRIERNNDFKQSMLPNLLLVRADLLDLWPMFAKHQTKFNIVKQYVLYPNPYPKNKHVKMRWHGHAIFPSIMAIKAPIELRSNWKLYLEEFLLAANEFHNCTNDIVEEFIPEVLFTPFERKFFNSGQKLFRLKLNYE